MSNGEKITPTLSNYLIRRGISLKQLLQSNCCTTLDEARSLLTSLDVSDSPSDLEIKSALPVVIKKNEVTVADNSADFLKQVEAVMSKGKEDSAKEELQALGNSAKEKLTKKAKKIGAPD